MSEKIRVLYIDDDAGLGRLLQRAMDAKGIEVHHATTSEDGLSRLKNGGFDVIALDHNLINETGIDVLARLGEFEDVPPVIYVTGSEDVRTAMAALKAGAVDYVWKDVQGHYRELLAESIHSAMAQQRLKREKDSALRQLTEAKERAEVMLSEVNHRIANSLSLVVSLTRMQATVVSDPAAREALAEMQARIGAIAGVHRRLYTSPDVRNVQLDDYLSGLVGELELALNTERRHRLLLRADSVAVPTDCVVSLGVLLTELVTNAYKYAYPKGQSGEIRVNLSRAGDGELTLSVEDDGVGWQGAGPAQGTGLGTRIIAAMASNLQSQVEYAKREHGTQASIRFRCEEPSEE